VLLQLVISPEIINELNEATLHGSGELSRTCFGTLVILAFVNPGNLKKPLPGGAKDTIPVTTL